MNLFDRFVLTLYSLMLTVVSIIVMAISLNVVPLDFVQQTVSDIYQIREIQIIYFIFAAIFFIISLRFLVFGYKRNKPAPSVIQQGEIGEIKITLETLESLAVKAARKVRGIRELKAKVQPMENGSLIHLKVSVDGETSIPQLTDELQKNVKHDVEQIAGIHVDKVTVLISDVNRPQISRSRVE